MSFTNIPPILGDALTQRGYEKLTAVQDAVIKDEATGRDLIVSAQTGSGKTVAFGLAMADQMLGMLAHHEEQVGVSIKDDLLAALGDELISWSMPMAALGAAPETAILLKVRDEQKFLDSLTKLTALSDGMVELKKSERRKITVYSIKIELPRMRGMPFNPLDMFAPTFSFKNIRVSRLNAPFVQPEPCALSVMITMQRIPAALSAASPIIC